ncbi:MAG: universal stress protein [Lautropia sp.]
MYQRILVPIDGSATAAAGLDEAVRVAKAMGGQIRLLHVVEPPPVVYTGGPAALLTGEMLVELTQAGEDLLRDAEKRVQAAGVAVDTRLVDEIGSPLASEVERQIEDWNADLLVIGTHGRRGIRRVLLGSDAEQVLRRTRIPVLLIRAEPTSEPASAAVPTARSTDHAG